MSGTFPTHAMVLAAGLGVRMRPLTNDRPKPMIEVQGRSMIDRALDHLVQVGIKNAVVNTSYLAAVMERHLAGRKDIALHISREEAPLETGGGIARALPHLGEQPFFSLNGDIVWLDGATPALKRLAAAWDDRAMDALLLVNATERSIGYEGAGDFFLGPKGEITRRGEQPSAPFVFTGIQLIHPRLFANSPGGAFSINQLYNRDLSRIRALEHDGYWLHIGDPEGLKNAESFLSKMAA